MNRIFLSLTTVVSLVACAGALHAQASTTASKTLGISAFGAGALQKPDYGSVNNYGVTVGADITRHFNLFDPSLEVRFGYGTGNTVSENYFLGGLKAERLVHNRYHPYITALVGHGNINYQTPIQFPSGPLAHDDSIVYAGGAGLDFDVSSNFAVKGDFSYQHWKLGAIENSLTPVNISAGIVYRIPFRGLRGRRY